MCVGNNTVVADAWASGRRVEESRGPNWKGGSPIEQAAALGEAVRRIVIAPDGVASARIGRKRTIAITIATLRLAQPT